MPKIPKKTIGGRAYCNYDSKYLENALERIRKGEMSIRKASEMYAVPRTTLQDKMKEVHMGKIGRPCVLSTEEEDCLKHGLLQCAAWGFPLTPKDVRLIVKGYLDREGRRVTVFTDNLPGDDWVRGFLHRHPNLSSRFCENIKRARASVGSKEINEYFDNLEKALVGIPPENIVNYDETNFFDDPGKVKVIVKRGTKHPERITDSSKSGVSVMMAGTASGDFLPPYVLYKAKHLYPGWTEGGIDGSQYNRNDSAWFDLEMYEDWFLKICLPYLRKLPGRKIIIGDNLNSHLSLEVIRLCENNDIGFILLPPNLTHLTQPLDVALFRPLKVSWRKMLDGWKNQNRGTVPKTEFPRILRSAVEAIGPEKLSMNLKSGFRSAGISPTNRDAVLKRLPESGQNKNSEVSWSDSFTELLKSVRFGEKKTAKAKGKRLNIKAGKSVPVIDIISREMESEQEEVDDLVQIDSSSSAGSNTVGTIDVSPFADETYSAGDFVLVQFLTEKNQRFYATEILNAGNTYEIKCLRKKSGKQLFFVFPDNEDVCSVQKNQLVRKLQPSSPIRRGRFIFSNITDSCDIF